jgi:outer membrane lipoprotein SlyB
LPDFRSTLWQNVKAIFRRFIMGKIGTLLCACVLALAGCASIVGGADYSADQTRGEMTVRMGVVDSVRNVNIEGNETPFGSLAGTAIGGIAGSTLGQGRGSLVASILGAVAGGVAGNIVERGVTRQTGVEITVRLDSGDLIAVTQGADEQFAPGDRVRILSGAGATRVTR